MHLLNYGFGDSEDAVTALESLLWRRELKHARVVSKYSTDGVFGKLPERCYFRDGIMLFQCCHLGTRFLLVQKRSPM